MIVDWGKHDGDGENEKEKKVFKVTLWLPYDLILPVNHIYNLNKYNVWQMSLEKLLAILVYGK